MSSMETSNAKSPTPTPKNSIKFGQKSNNKFAGLEQYNEEGNGKNLMLEQKREVEFLVKNSSLNIVDSFKVNTFKARAL